MVYKGRQEPFMILKTKVGDDVVWMSPKKQFYDDLMTLRCGQEIEISEEDYVRVSPSQVCG